MKLNESIEKKSLEGLLKDLEKKSKNNIEKNSLVYETGDKKHENIIYTEMTRTPEIEEQSINFVTDLMNKTLLNSKNSKIKELLNFKKEKLV